MAKKSAGIILCRKKNNILEIMLVHPGGPFWAKKDVGVWSIPKGLLEIGEEPLAAACREFREETGFTSQGPYIPLGEVRQKAGKIVRAWAFKGDADPAMLVSNMTRLEMPRGSGRWLEIPEVDRAAQHLGYPDRPTTATDGSATTSATRTPTGSPTTSSTAAR